MVESRGMQRRTKNKAKIERQECKIKQEIDESEKQKNMEMRKKVAAHR